MKALSSETKAALSSEIREVNNRFVLIYVFLAVFTTATCMANLKDFVASLK